MKTQSNKHFFPGIIRLIFLASLLASGCLLVYVPVASAASGKGHIYGRLLDSTNKNAPVGGQSVTLQMAQGNSGKDLMSVKTDSQGRFDFAGLDTSGGVLYAVYTRYQGAQYNTDLLHLDKQAAQQANLTVYEATSSINGLAVVQATALMHQPDSAHGLISISEIFSFKNVDTRTYVGSFDTKNGKPNALRFALPTGARDLSLSRGFDGYQAISVDKGFASDAALPPGNSQFAFSFNVPYSGTTCDFSYKAVYPTLSFSLLAPPSLHVNSDIMQTGGIVTAGDQNSYRVMQVSKMVADHEVHATLEGLPTPTVANQTSAADLRWVWLLVGILILMAIIVVSTFLYRITHKDEFAYQNRGGNKRHHKGTSGQALRTGDKYRDDSLPAHRSGSHDGHHEAHPSRVSSRNQRKNELMQELLSLDRSYEAGKMSKDHYQKRREGIKAQLRMVMNADDVIPRAASQHRPPGRSERR